MSAQPTCQCNLGTDDEPKICGAPAEWMQPGEAWMTPDEWPVCGHCAADDAYPLAKEPCDECAKPAAFRYRDESDGEVFARMCTEHAAEFEREVREQVERVERMKVESEAPRGR